MDVFLLNIDDVIFADYYDFLSTKRKKIIDSITNEKKKKEKLVSGLMERFLLEKDYEDVSYNSYGKPLCKNIYYNISHSASIVVGVKDVNPIGLDIERERVVKDVKNKVFTQNEIKFLKKDNESFFKLWTIKESVMKKEGLGFKMDISSFDVLPLNSDEHFINGNSYFIDYLKYDDYYIALTTTKKEKINIIKLTKHDLSF